MAEFAYYGRVKLAKNPGKMVGRRVVREWDPRRSMKRTWNETLDGKGNVRIVRPENNDGSKRHFYFNDDGSYGGVG